MEDKSSGNHHNFASVHHSSKQTIVRGDNGGVDAPFFYVDHLRASGMGVWGNDSSGMEVEPGDGGTQSVETRKPQCCSKDGTGAIDMNVGRTNAKIIATLNSQFPGIQFIGSSFFGSRLQIPNEVLEKTFFLDENTINHVRSSFM
ncbi:uncharacterized protein LOC112346300 [Selaginella moellendorffii]|uniref:uncharacterized protein LOC112346300 n=1 Tax=Selaginella moellendorffii TaxID=88036 RepID=UPI000D1C3BFE|nr:uncharacterized protein LOC112346300 [Selaginella moellendorffii]|eukprot:XP_024530707.1 uncharacterized protein LOC112346300 [Selaginella moellendorffii]